jgi:metal-responsive CopG/Arc/MetJ family transcriptional regulator
LPLPSNLSTNSPGEKIERISFAMPHSLLARVDKICSEMGMSRSHYLRGCIEEKNSRLYDKLDQVLDVFAKQRSA